MIRFEQTIGDTVAESRYHRESVVRDDRPHSTLSGPSRAITAALSRGRSNNLRCAHDFTNTDAKNGVAHSVAGCAAGATMDLFNAVTARPLRRDPGESPAIRVTIAASKAGLLDFTIDVERATMPTLPTCTPGPSLGAHLGTSFSLTSASDPAPVLSVHAAQDWQCKVTQLRTP